MAVILLEALLALIILIAIVWWTMFSGRPSGELPADPAAQKMTGGEKTPPDH